MVKSHNLLVNIWVCRFENPIQKVVEKTKAIFKLASPDVDCLDPWRT